MYSISNNIRNCNICELCRNQQPLVQQSSYADIFWVGLSAVKTSDKLEIPLSPSTNSGKLINSVELILQNKSFYKTNLVKCLPLENDKIRYPSMNEMKGCHFHLKDEIQYFKPKLVFLLGKQVASFVLREFGVSDFSLDNEYNYSSFIIDNCKYIPIHHPSFILVYKRKKMLDYLKSIENIIKELDKNNKDVCRNTYNVQKTAKIHVLESALAS
jgi:DNA polymerase